MLASTSKRGASLLSASHHHRPPPLPLLFLLPAFLPFCSSRSTPCSTRLRSIHTSPSSLRNPKSNDNSLSGYARALRMQERNLRSKRALLLEQLPAFVRSPYTLSRLQRLGIPTQEAQHLLNHFLEVAQFELEDLTSDAALVPLGWDTVPLLSSPVNVSRQHAAHQVLFHRLADVAPLTSPLRTISAATDHRRPSLAFPQARSLKRKLILHVGPTNSGKTHSALLALSRARTGVYAGPLRLLAHEVFTRLNEGTISPGIGPDGNPLPPGPPRTCNLLTGEEVRVVDPQAGLTSCTVEMIPLGAPLDVAVIDEIQMIADETRGGAWTNAVLGVMADEVHICGEDRVVPLMEEIARETGDELIVNRYQRLTPLKIGKPLVSLDNIRKGDCLVTFSRSGIWALKRQVEEKTGLRCAVAYGGLPPETRAEQARLFNEPDNGWDVMIASDAIGMGLNLKIKRVVFETMHKWDGQAERQLSISQTKQIAGRAGRYGLHKSSKTPQSSPTGASDPDLDADPSAAQPSDSSVGEATTLNELDLPLLQAALDAPLPTIKRAGLMLDISSIESMASCLATRAPLSTLFVNFDFFARTSPHYFFGNLAGASKVADIVESAADGLSLAERVKISQAPANIRDEIVVAGIQAYAHAHAAGGTVDAEECLRPLGVIHQLESVERIQLASQQTSTSPDAVLALSRSKATESLISPQTLSALESLHRALVLYLWLSYRYKLSFNQRRRARALKERAEIAIEFCLRGIRWESGMVRRKGAKGRSHALRERGLVGGPTESKWARGGGGGGQPKSNWARSGGFGGGSARSGGFGGGSRKKGGGPWI